MFLSRILYHVQLYYFLGKLQDANKFLIAYFAEVLKDKKQQCQRCLRHRSKRICEIVDVWKCEICKVAWHFKLDWKRGRLGHKYLCQFLRRWRLVTNKKPNKKPKKYAVDDDSVEEICSSDFFESSICIPIFEWKQWETVISNIILISQNWNWGNVRVIWENFNNFGFVNIADTSRLYTFMRKCFGKSTPPHSFKLVVIFDQYAGNKMLQKTTRTPIIHSCHAHWTSNFHANQFQIMMKDSSFISFGLFSLLRCLFIKNCFSLNC